MPASFFVIGDSVENNSCRNTRCQVKNDLVLGASRWPVFTRPSLAAFHLTPEGWDCKASAVPFRRRSGTAGNGSRRPLPVSPTAEISKSSQRADGEFFLKAVDAQLTFDGGLDGRATQLTLHQDGTNQTAARLNETETKRAPESQAAVVSCWGRMLRRGWLVQCHLVREWWQVPKLVAEIYRCYAMFSREPLSYIYFGGQRTGMKHSTFHSAKSGRFVVLARTLGPRSSRSKKS